jgi:hypothetical protein
MCDRLTWKGYRSGSELFYLVFPEAKHDERAWASKRSTPFQFLFERLPMFRLRAQIKWSLDQASHCESNANIRGHRIRFNRLDSTGAYENSLAKLLAARPIR